MTLKISLIIPTRERLEYLPCALASAQLAADRAGAEVEILVSDNASGDGTDAWLAKQRDPRLRVIRSERRLSMRENYQFALENATGSHLIYIGDDDAVLPHGLALARQMIETKDVDIYKWRVENYHWPDPASGTDGWVKIRPQHLDGRCEMIDPAAVLSSFCNASFRTYHDGGMIYHGMISRRLVDRVVAKTGGPYFRGSSPDLYTSVQALVIGDRPIMKVNLPLTMGGTSPRSNGASAQQRAKIASAAESPEFMKFIRESAEDPYQCRLPARVPSLILVTLDGLTEAARQCGRELDLDMAAWSARVAREIAGFVEPDRSDCVALARMFFGPDFDIPPAASPVSGAPRAKDAMRRSNAPGRIRAVGGPPMQDALTAADFIDRLTRLETSAGRHFGPVSGFVRMLRMHGTAARLFESAPRPLASWQPAES
ncbi:glycosyltransferase [Pseudomonas sp. GX19020]|uniref:glycosyltransferase family 2 protein n=1 Tax=Pseudomonas sp. GX19020 TaxID=2942277 RepID=UPI0020190BF2|nr:glycosyltransferase [Pseudomonas sp. GX19020]MCL4068479.1 glycosyltransferase [Pseudomonas sp. GX19020]